MPFFVGANSPVNDFLLAAQTDMRDVTDNGYLPTDMNTIGSFIEQAQFRFNSSTPTNNVDIKKDALSYELRIKPKAWGQRDIEKNILQLRVKQQGITYQQLLNSALKKRYLRLLDYVEQYHRLQYQHELSELLAQQAQWLQSQVISDQFNPEKLLDTKEMLKLTQGQIKLNNQRLNIFEAQLALPLTSVDSMQNRSSIDWVVNATEINNTLASHNEIDYLSPEILNARLKVLLSQSENQLLKAKRQLGVNLIKFEYSDRENDQMAFQVGINIPLGAGFSNQNNQYKIYTAQAQLKNSVASIKQSLSDISSQINWLSENWQLLQNQCDRTQQHLQQNYAKTNPDVLISLRKELIGYQQKQVEINTKSLTLFVSYLSLSGQLTQAPLRNWIQHGTPPLSLN